MFNYHRLQFHLVILLKGKETTFTIMHLQLKSGKQCDESCCAVDWTHGQNKWWGDLGHVVLPFLLFHSYFPFSMLLSYNLFKQPKNKIKCVMYLSSKGAGTLLCLYWFSSSAIKVYGCQRPLIVETSKLAGWSQSCTATQAHRHKPVWQ